MCMHVHSHKSACTCAVCMQVSGYAKVHACECVQVCVCTQACVCKNCMHACVCVPVYSGSHLSGRVRGPNVVLSGDCQGSSIKASAYIEGTHGLSRMEGSSSVFAFLSCFKVNAFDV